ncbi:hypothetical protein [Chachezhania sediminis]|uniref:hypothetical protein n=1 Tax=Chachezhania sediminis TaxID=2599291 RepID=UPI001E3A2273|nr:hypothetical protein [Chachezhania sediminis]
MTVIPFPKRATGAKDETAAASNPDSSAKERAPDMIIDRTQAPRSLSDDLSRQLSALYGPCIDCADCNGLCHELIEALMLPGAVLNRPSRRRTDDEPRKAP